MLPAGVTVCTALLEQAEVTDCQQRPFVVCSRTWCRWKHRTQAALHRRFFGATCVGCCTTTRLVLFVMTANAYYFARMYNTAMRWANGIESGFRTVSAVNKCPPWSSYSLLTHSDPPNREVAVSRPWYLEETRQGTNLRDTTIPLVL